MRTRVRVVLALLAAAAAAAPLGCAGDDPAEPLTIEERLPSDAEAEGFAVKRVYRWPEAEGPVENAFASALNNPETRDEAKQLLRAAGYVDGTAVVRARALNDELFVMALRLGSPAGARDVLEWEHREAMKPCPGVCNVVVSSFEVDGIAGAKGVQRLVGPPMPGQAPPAFDRFIVLFTDGSAYYLVERAVPPGSIKRLEAVEYAKRLRERVRGAPFPN